MIVSASRRTDIPAFYAEWLLRRLTEGYALVRNPVSPHQVGRVPLTCEQVDCLVLWTRNPGPLAARLDRLMALFDPFDETVELIGELDEAGYGLYVLSNMPEEFMTYVERLDVLRHFDGLVISSRVHLAKPDPRIFALLGERYGVVPGQTLFVDDKPSNTEAAARLGFRTCTFRPDGAGCDAVRRQLGLVSGEEER